MLEIARRASRAISRLLGVLRRPKEPTLELPAWARVGGKRRAHIRRVAELLEHWAEEMGVSGRERDRWLSAAWLHDALRDARLTRGVPHGAAAAHRAELEGESDCGVLDAVRHHSVGYAGWDDVGKMLYLADYLEPGRKRRAKQRAELAGRVPRERDRVLREVVALQIRAQLRSGRPIDPRTLDFWNSLAR
ncbi:MAG TPA: HD domain-containing protein [Gemmatimonadales bacterium]|nr:HD domain-containing protein [Gemmatimonadales bacterium]